MSGILKKIGLFAISAGLTIPENPVVRYLELSRFKILLFQLGINCVIDVGANRGQFADEIRGIGYKGKIISFEPVQREFSFLKERFKNDKSWCGFQIAFGSEKKLL